MTHSSLELSPIQQAWLRELQVASVFLMPAPSAATLQDQRAGPPVSDTPIKTTGTATRTMPAAARAQLHDQLGLKKSIASTAITDDVSPQSQPVALEALNQLNLEQIQHYADQCSGCALHEQRQRAVLGAGHTDQPDWMVISIAPSSNEEMAGLPMQGKTGELFAHQLQSITVPRDLTFYTTQLVKCRSPHHTKSDYIHACQQILWRQIELIQPRHILLLGEAGAELFFEANASFDELRAEVQSWQRPDGVRIPVVVTFDPVSLLLRPQDKVKAWADLLLMQTLF